MMGPLEAVGTSLKRYAKFSGRATRAEFWWFQIFYWICFYGSQALGGILNQYSPGIAGGNGLALAGVVNLLLITPMLSVQVRRLHDVGVSGWWVGAAYISSFAFLGLGALNWETAGLTVLLLLLAHAGLSLLLMLFIIVQYFRKTNAKGDKYGSARESVEVPLKAPVQAPIARGFVPEEYVPQAHAAQNYAPQPFAPQNYAPQYYAQQPYAAQSYGSYA